MNHKVSAQSTPILPFQKQQCCILEILPFFLSTYDVKILEIRLFMEGRAHPLDKTSLPRHASRLKQLEQELSSSRRIPQIYMDGIITNMTRRIIPKGSIPHVCIVGAGISGLRCAEVLIKKGVKVTILEGRDRVGGRVHQSDHLGHLVDLGPNWIHGSHNNPILDLAYDTNSTVVTPEMGKSVVFNESGHQLSEQTGQDISRIVWGIIDDAFNYSNEESATIPPEMSLMDFFRAKVKEKKLDRYTSKLVLQHAQIWGDYVGEPTETQSLKYMWLEECIDDENLFVASTYRSILARIAGTALAKADLHLSTKVTSFTSDVSDPQKPKVSLTTANSLFPQTFDDIIITAPLGWLKRNLGAFNPSLSPRLTKALNNVSYGRLEKVYISFEKAFWHDHESNPPFYTQFLCPAYAPLQNPHRWTLEPASLASLPKATAQPILLFYLNGPCSAHVTSMVSSLQANSSEYYNLLTEFFHPYYSLLPNYDAASPICQPVKILSTDWQHDEFAGWGSYTNFQVSTVSPKKPHHLGGDEVEINPMNAAAAEASRNSANMDTESTEERDYQERVDDEVHIDKDIEVLRQGCPERGIWFAGEHTAPFVAVGTTTGAYWSGEAVGNRVLAAYGLGSYEDALAIEHEGLRMTATNGSASVKAGASVDRRENTGRSC